MSEKQETRIKNQESVGRWTIGGRFLGDSFCRAGLKSCVLRLETRSEKRETRLDCRRQGDCFTRDKNQERRDKNQEARNKTRMS